MGGIAGLPHLIVEIAWGATPADIHTGASITWTDVTAWLRVTDAVSWGRGRSSEQDSVTAGSGSFTFNTTNAAGVAFHGGNERRLRTPIRVRWYDTIPASAVTLWTGAITDWGGGWTNGVRASTRVTATDLVSRAARKTLQALPVQASLGVGTVQWVYPCDEESGAVSAADRLGSTLAPRLSVVQVGAGGTAEFGVGYSPGSLSTSAESTVASFAAADASNYKRLYGTGLPELGNIWTVHVMLLPAAIGATMTPISVEHATGASSVTIGITAAGKATATVTPRVGGAATITGTTTLTASAWSHIGVTYSNTGAGVGTNTTIKLYVNGAQEGATTTTTHTISPLTVAYIGTGGYTGNACNLTAHTTALSDANMLTIGGGWNGWDNELTSARLARVAAAAGWTNTSIGTGVTSMSPMPTKGVSLSDAFQAIADTEIAPWWLAGDAAIRFDGRDARYDVAPAFEVPAQAVSPDTQFTVSDVGLTNKVTASRPGGAQVTRVNADSVTAYDEYSNDLTLYVRTDADLENVAAALTNMRATPQIRTDSIVIDLHTTATSISDVTAAITADVGDMVRVTGLPTDHTATADVDFFIEGVADSVSTGGWKRTFNVSPAGTYTVWKVEDAIYGVLDSTTRVGF